MNKNLPLFFFEGEYLSGDFFLNKLEEINAFDCDLLYIHSSISFGVPNPSLSRTQILSELIKTLDALGVKTICMPTFTFSFCNGLDFDMQKSRTKMGALNEYFRKSCSVIRSRDPLLSVAVKGQHDDLINGLGKSSIGKNSHFAAVDAMENVKFLFFGTSLASCFTYMHYLEFIANVPYRYERSFAGKIKNKSETTEEVFKLFIRYNGVYPNLSNTEYYANILEESEAMKQKALGASFISSVGKEKARSIYFELLEKDPNFFVNEPFNLMKVNKYFKTKNMVAL